MLHRIVMVFEYIGTNFAGFQVQPVKRTVQSVVEEQLSKIIDEEVKIYASGRTDSGVHSLGQVAHFDTEKDIDCNRLLYELNDGRFEDIDFLKVFEAPSTFDSRFSVKVKTYSYRFYLSRFERVMFKNRALRVNDNVSIEKMKSGLNALIGTHDFTSFVARKSGKTDFVRTIYSASINELGDGLYEFEISGNGFLYNMVRIIMGTLIDMGAGRKDGNAMSDIIQGKNRSLAGKTVPPYGLYMKSVKYDDISY